MTEVELTIWLDEYYEGFKIISYHQNKKFQVAYAGIHENDYVVAICINGTYLACKRFATLLESVNYTNTADINEDII